MIESIFFAGVTGALLGSLISLLATIIGGRLHHHRELLHQATQVAIEDFKVCSALAGQNGTQLFPMSTYLHYHLHFLRLAERGQLDEAAIKRLLEERGRILDLYALHPEDRHAFMCSTAGTLQSKTIPAAAEVVPDTIPHQPERDPAALNPLRGVA